jgi:hypothetical protein
MLESDPPIAGVMPLRISRTGLDRDYREDAERARLTLRSLEENLRGDGRFDLHVVCPPEDLEATRDALSAVDLRRVRLVSHDETPFLGEAVARDRRIRGFTRQQLVKLAFAAECPARFCITFDSDVVLLRPLDPAELVLAGRGLLQDEAVKAHPEWWDAAGAVLGRGVTYEQGMSVTPAVLATEGVRSLIGALRARAAGADWRAWLAGLHAGGTIWTEYTLYFHHLMLEGLVDRLHARGPAARMILIRSVWRRDHFEGWSVPGALAGGAGWFAVLQSSAGLSVEEVRARVWPSIRPD